MKTVRMTIDVPVEMHKIIKAYATISGSNIKNYVIDAIKNRLKKEKDIHIPNKKTIAAFEESLRDEKDGKLKSYRNLQEFLDEVDEEEKND